MRALVAILNSLSFFCPSPINAQTLSMKCKFDRVNMFRSTDSPAGKATENARDHLIEITLSDGELVKIELHSQGVIETKLDIVVANTAYKGNIIALQSSDLFAEATLWSISFTRREVAVSLGLSAHYTEGGVQ